MQKPFMRLIAIVAAAQLTACTSVIAPSTTTSPTVVVTPSETPSSTPRPTATSRPTKTPSPTDTPTITPTYGSDLTYEQQIEIVESMLRTNGGCDLPCFWGGTLVPGKSTSVEADVFFDSLGLPLEYEPLPPHISFAVPPSVSGQYIFDLATQRNNEGTINFLEVEIATSSGRPFPRFTQAWRDQYAWDRVLTNLGVPSQVLIRVQQVCCGDPPIGNEILAKYWLTLVYDSLGMAIQYVGTGDLIYPKVRGCPMTSNVVSIRLILVDPQGQAKPLDIMSGLENPDFPRPYLEDKSDLSLADFYEIFKEANGTACFEGDAN